jgi:hypothetical protein
MALSMDQNTPGRHDQDQYSDICLPPGHRGWSEILIEFAVAFMDRHQPL